MNTISVNLTLTSIPIESEPGKLSAPTADTLTVSFIVNYCSFSVFLFSVRSVNVVNVLNFIWG